MMTSSAKLTNEQSLHLEFINRFQCGSHHEHGQGWNITHQGWTIQKKITMAYRYLYQLTLNMYLYLYHCKIDFHYYHYLSVQGSLNKYCSSLP